MVYYSWSHSYIVEKKTCVPLRNKHLLHCHVMCNCYKVCKKKNITKCSNARQIFKKKTQLECLNALQSVKKSGNVCAITFDNHLQKNQPPQTHIQLWRTPPFSQQQKHSLYLHDLVSFSKLSLTYPSSAHPIDITTN